MNGIGHWFVPVSDAPRVRRASDVTALVLGLALVGWAAWARSARAQAVSAADSVAAALPDWVLDIARLLYFLGFAYGVLVLVAFVVAGKVRRPGLRDVLLGALVAALLGSLLTWLSGAAWPHLWPEIGEAAAGSSQFPVMRVAVVSAVLLAASPHLARPVRRLGWGVVLLVAASAFALGFGDLPGSTGGLGVGMVAASLVLLAFGSPRGYPDPAEVAEGLAQLDVEVHDLEVDPDQSWGVRRLLGTRDDGTRVEVKAYGRDATESQLVSKAWHALMYRGGWSGLTLSRLQQVEHEALVTMLAARAGAAVPEVLAAASGSDTLAILALEHRGRRLADLEAGDVDDATLVAVWRDVARLHTASITHGGLDADAVLVADDGRHLITDFTAGSLVHSSSGAAFDVVELLFSMSVVVGAERTVTAAQEGLGVERLAAALPYLQLPAVSGRTRRSADKAKAVLADLRDRVVAVTGEQAPAPVKLRRLGLRDLLTLVVLGLFISAMIPILAGVDYAELWSELQDADWSLVLIAFVVSWTIFFSQAVSMMFAVARALPLRPVVVLEVAITFISFAVPGVAGRVAMNTAFLHRYGVAPAVAVTQGAIDAFAGFLTQCALLLVAFATGAVSLSAVSAAAQDGASPSGSPSPSVSASTAASATPTPSASATAAAASGSSGGVSWGLVLLIFVALAAVVVVVVLRVKRVHDRVVPVIVEAWRALATLLRSPSRALGLFSANLVTQLLFGVVLWLCLLSLDYHLGYLSAVVAVVATSLLQGIIPVPGGIGVSEAVMTAFLATMGVPSDIAMAATILWRLFTFYIPATVGFFAARWLSSHDYV